MSTTTYRGNERYNNAITALNADYETKVQALRNGMGDVPQTSVQRGRTFVDNPALVVSSALTIGLLVGAVIGRRNSR